MFVPLIILFYISIVFSVPISKRGPENEGGENELGFLSQVANTNLIKTYEQQTGNKYLLPFRNDKNNKYISDVYKSEYIGNGFVKGDGAYGSPDFNWGTAGESTNGRNFVFITKTVFAGENNYKQGWEDLTSLITSDSTLTPSNPDSNKIVNALKALQASIKFRNEELNKFAGNGDPIITKNHEDMSIKLQDCMESLYNHLLLKGNVITFKPVYNKKFPPFKTIPNHIQAEVSLLNKIKQLSGNTDILPSGSPQVNNDELVPSSVWKGTTTLFKENDVDGSWTKVSQAMNDYASKNPKSVQALSMKGDLDASLVTRLDALKGRQDTTSSDYKDKLSNYEHMSYASNEFVAVNKKVDVVAKPVIEYESLIDPAEYSDSLKTDVYYQTKLLVNNINPGIGNDILPEGNMKNMNGVLIPPSLYKEATSEADAFKKTTDLLVGVISDKGNIPKFDAKIKQTYRRLMYTYKKYLNSVESTFSKYGVQSGQFPEYTANANKFNTIKSNDKEIMKPVLSYAKPEQAIEDDNIPFDLKAEDTGTHTLKKQSDFPGSGTKLMSVRQNSKKRTRNNKMGRFGAGNVRG